MGLFLFLGPAVRVSSLKHELAGRLHFFFSPAAGGVLKPSCRACASTAPATGLRRVEGVNPPAVFFPGYDGSASLIDFQWQQHTPGAGKRLGPS